MRGAARPTHARRAGNALWKVGLALLALATPGLAQTPVRLTLEEAEAAALKNNPQISEATFQAMAADEGVIQAKSGYYPAFTGHLTGVYGMDERLAVGALNAGAIVTRAAVGMNLVQMVTDFGRTSQLVASSRYRADSQRNQAEATRSLVLLQVRRNYLNTLRAKAVLSVAEQTVASRQLLADQAAELARAKLKSGLDVSFANVNLSEAKLLLVAARNNLHSAEADLSSGLGYSAPQSFELAEAPLPDPPRQDSQALVAEALGKRPDALSVRASLEASRRLAEAEKALRYPTITAAGSAGFVPWRRDDDLGPRFGAIGFNVSIPVFNGHLFSSRQHEAELRVRASEQQLKDLENRIARDVTTARLNSQRAYERLSLAAALREQAAQAQELAQSRYDLGLSSIVELSQAQLNMTAADIQHASAKYEFQIEDSVLRYNLGALR